MAVPIKLKRRWTGTTDAPASLLSGEPAYNGVNDIFYIGKGDDGAGNATSVQIVGGLGAFMGLTTDQNVNGLKTFVQSPIVPTPTVGDNSTKAASTAFVQAAISAISIPDGDKGDITVSGSGSIFTIDAGAVTLAKMANLAANSFIGNNTGAAATPTALSPAQAKTLLGLTKSDVGLANVENTALSTWIGSSAITSVGVISSGTWNGATIATNKGGTGLTSFTTNGLLYAASTSALGQIAVVNNGVLVTNGSGVPSISTTLPSNLMIANARNSVAAAVSAAGTTQATATALTADYNVVTTVGAGSGVVLPATVAGLAIEVINKGASALLVYPPVSSAFDGLATNAAISLPVGMAIKLEAVTASLWYSSLYELTSASALAGTIPAANMPGLTGDITSSAGSLSTAIAAGAVTLAKMANLPANTFIGNNTAGSATPVALTVAQAKTLLALTKSDVGLSNVDNTSDANKPISSAVASALSNKIDSALIGAANGVTPLGSDSKIPAIYLPGFVDDVVEYANYAALPATGTAGILYVTVDTNFTYRWSGSTYIQINAAPGSTDAVPEGSVNKYYTAARAQADVVASNITSGDTSHSPSGAAVFTAVAGKLSVASNLSDLNNAGTARSNLGLGTMATQSAASVAITGGTINNVTIDGGVY